MIPRKMLVLAATAVALLLAGCAGVKGGVPPNLVGTAWLVEDLENAGVIDRLQSTLEFPQEGKAAGNLGCNRFTAGFTQSGPLLSFGMLAGSAGGTCVARQARRKRTSRKAVTPAHLCQD